MVFDGGAAVKPKVCRGLPPATRSRRCVVHERGAMVFDGGAAVKA